MKHTAFFVLFLFHFYNGTKVKREKWKEITQRRATKQDWQVEWTKELNLNQQRNHASFLLLSTALCSFVELKLGLLGMGGVVVGFVAFVSFNLITRNESEEWTKDAWI